MDVVIVKYYFTSINKNLAFVGGFLSHYIQGESLVKCSQAVH